MADDIRRWSDELARDPSSLVFLQLGEALRRQRQFDVALKIALRGLGRHPRNAEAHDLVERINADAAGAGLAESTALETVRRPTGGVSAAMIPSVLPPDPQWLFADLLIEEGQTALLLDGNGYVIGGLYLDDAGEDLGQEIGAQLSGISDEVQRATRHLDLGEWRSITFETHEVKVAMSPSADGSLVVVAAAHATPLGLLRRLLDRCAERASRWLNKSGHQ
jgi:predicted regulator of Ras-like GTPase activity (Roadblock/LC7/MglB family)